MQAQQQTIAYQQEWLRSLDRRMQTTGQGQAIPAHWQPALSATHLAELHAILTDLARTTKRPYAELVGELTQTFTVSAVTAIPDDLWLDVLAWYAWRAKQA